jgi:hypothetical protein
MNTILDQRLRGAVAHLKAPPVVALAIPWDDALAAIVSGKAKLKPAAELDSYTQLRNAYLFPEYEKKLAAYRKELDLFTRACEIIQKPIKAAHRMAMDKLMMSNAEAALEVIEWFAQGK